MTPKTTSSSRGRTMAISTAAAPRSDRRFRVAPAEVALVVRFTGALLWTGTLDGAGTSGRPLRERPAGTTHGGYVRVIACLRRLGRREGVARLLERVADLGSEERHGADDGDRDQGDHQGVLDGGRALLRSADGVQATEHLGGNVVHWDLPLGHLHRVVRGHR